MRRAEEVLRETFGFHDFQGLQRPVIECVLGGGDAMVLMPTGGGKSLCYQLPALILPGVCLVVSPLIALMRDQVQSLRQMGVRAAAINSSLVPGEAAQLERAMQAGELDLVYVAPERLLTERFLSVLDRTPLALFAIDEAHCVSQWGPRLPPGIPATGGAAGPLAERAAPGADGHRRQAHAKRHHHPPALRGRRDLRRRVRPAQPALRGAAQGPRPPPIAQIHQGSATRATRASSTACRARRSRPAPSG